MGCNNKNDTEHRTQFAVQNQFNSKATTVDRLLSLPSIVCLGLICGLLSPTAMADITRHCNAEVSVAQNGAPDAAIYNFTVHKTANRTRAYATILRANTKARITRCLRDHWHIRNSDVPPRSCLDDDSTDFINYPFTNLNEDIIQAMCPAYSPPGSSALIKLVDVTLTVTGKGGCGRDPITIADNAEIRCPTLPPTQEEEQPAASSGSEPEEAREQPVIGDGGGFECVGEGCGGAAPETEEEPPVAEAEEPAPAAEEPPADDGLPATASYRLLPFMRLPGNDLRLIEMSSPNWMLCRQACTDDERCGAFTYRAPNANSGPLCLLKSRGGLQIPDPCCQSGLKN